DPPGPGRRRPLPGAGPAGPRVRGGGRRRRPLVAAERERRTGAQLLVGRRRAGRVLPPPGRRHPRRLLGPPARAGRHRRGGLMDPLASVREFRQQSAGPGRTLTVAPPPAIPVAPSPAALDDDLEIDGFDPTGDPDGAAIAAAGRSGDG